MRYLGIEEEVLLQNGALNTAKFIVSQPAVWHKTWLKAEAESFAFNEFLTANLQGIQRIIMTGTGYSASIGMSLHGYFQKVSGKMTEMIPATSLVSHPEEYFIRNITTCMITFARSGSSPETVEAVKLADELIDECYHIIITCNPNGRLAKCQTRHPNYKFLLPKEAFDKGFSMTVSYTSMLLAGMLMGEINLINRNRRCVDTLIEYSMSFLQDKLEVCREIAGLDFQKAIFLGSGPLLGVAGVSHFFFQELTGGSICCDHNSFLDFRHGPQSAFSNDSLMVCMMSNNSYVRKFEDHLFSRIKKGNRNDLQIGISEYGQIGKQMGKQFFFTHKESILPDEYLGIAMILPVQLIAFYKSLALGLRPDDAYKNTTNSNLVQGFRLHRF